MNPEKEIVNLWLNNQGFFTINDINAGKNRIIGIIAIKPGIKGPGLVQHVEVHCSISAGTLTNDDRRDIERRFNDPNVEKRVMSVVRDYVEPGTSYEKVLVTNIPEIELRGVRAISFEDALSEVLVGLDKQNYRNPVTRTMQLLKYVLMANPKGMARLLQEEGEHRVLKRASRKSFVGELLTHTGFKKPLKTEASEKMIIELLKYSSLKRPERLAEVLEKEILNQRAYNKFLRALLQQQSIKAEVKKEISRQQQKLESYFG